MRQNQILLLDEDKSLSRFLCKELHSQGYLVDHLTDADEVFRRLESGDRYDLLLLELNLSKIDGLNLIKKLRLTLPKLPIFVITSRNSIEDKVHSLHSGADDCMTKPLSLTEFLARVRALLRRNVGHIASQTVVDDLLLNREDRRVERNGRRIDLTPREFDLLDVMMQSAGRPVPRTTLLGRVWNVSAEQSTNIVDVYMKYVRDKVDGPGERKLIHTVRGIGYELRAE